MFGRKKPNNAPMLVIPCWTCEHCSPDSVGYHIYCRKLDRKYDFGPGSCTGGDFYSWCDCYKEY